MRQKPYEIQHSVHFSTQIFYLVLNKVDCCSIGCRCIPIHLSKAEVGSECVPMTGTVTDGLCKIHAGNTIESIMPAYSIRP